MSNRHLPAASPDDQVVFDPLAPAPLMGRGLDYIRAMEIADTPRSKEPVQVWRYEASLEDGVLNSVTIVDDIVVLVAAKSVCALSGATGTALWRLKLPIEYSDDAYIQLHNGTVFVHHKRAREVFAIDVRTGNEVWRRSCHPGFSWLSGLLYIATCDQDNHPSELVAIDPTDGHVRWVKRPAYHFRYEPGGSPPSLTAQHGMVYISAWDDSDGWLVYALAAISGRDVWQVYLDGDGSGWSQVRIRLVGEALVVDGRNWEGGAEVLVLDSWTGKQRWRCSIPDGYIHTSDKGVFVTDDEGMISALHIETGTERWRYVSGDRYSYPLHPVAEDTVYVDGGEGTFAALDRATGDKPDFGPDVPFSAFTALDIATGNTRWSLKVPGHSGDRAFTTRGGIVYLGSELYTPQDYDRVVLQAIDARTGAELWLIDLLLRNVFGPGDWSEPWSTVRSITATDDGVLVLTEGVLQVLRFPRLSSSL